MASSVDQLETVFKALADKTRLRILALLGDNEVCVCHMHDSLGVPQPTVSRHLAYLRRSGVVAARRDGVWMHYRVSPELTTSVRQVVSAAIDAMEQVPDAGKDQKRFQKAFGRLYVHDAPSGGACCVPRTVESSK